MEAIGTRDWAHLHPELLEMIAVRITEIVDRVCFSSVCHRWRSASKSVAHDLPPQLPWLLLPNDGPHQLLPLPRDSEDAGITTTARRFVSLSRNRIFHVPLPEPHPRGNRTNTNTFPSPFGQMVAVQGIETLALLNPLTRSPVPLPPLPLTDKRREKSGAFELRKAKVFASNLVAVVFPDDRDLLFCRPGESSWKRLDLDMASRYSIRDFVYYKGKFLVINSEDQTVWVFDAVTLQKISKIPLFGGFGILYEYLVESPAGDLLLVQMTWCETFELFQLDQSEEHVKWMHINSIGDTALFVDGLQAIAFDATASNGWRGNCIYFVDQLPSPTHGLTVFNVGDGEIEELKLSSYPSESLCGRPMWFVPTLC